jgi:O-antigen ligase
MQLWRGTLRALAVEPWSGLGLRGTEAALTRYAEWPMTTNPIWAHNDYVQALAELGVPAALLVACLAGMALLCGARELRRATRAERWSRDLLRRAAAAGALTALAHAAADFHLRIPLAGFVCLGLIALAVTPGGLLVSNRSYARLFGVRATLRHIRHLLADPPQPRDGDR